MKNEILYKPQNLDELRHFPFFSDLDPDSKTVKPEAYNIPLNTLSRNFSVRAKRAIKTLNLKTLLDLLMTKKTVFLNIPSIGRGTYFKVAQKLSTIFNSLDDFIVPDKITTSCSDKMKEIEKILYLTFPYFNESNPSVKCPNLDIPLEILNFNFSVRAQNGLENLSLNSLLKLLNCPKSDFCSAKNVGRKTYMELASAITRFLKKHANLLDDLNDSLNKNLTFSIDGTENKYPLFFDTDYIFDDTDLEHKNLNTINVGALDISSNIKHRLNELNISNLEQLLNTSSNALIENGGLVASEIKTLRSRVRTALLAMIYQDGKVYRDIDVFIEDLYDMLNKTISTYRSKLTKRPRNAFDRNYNFFKMRCGLDFEPKTLEEIGQLEGCTRERVRQVEKKFINLIHNIIPYTCKMFINSILYELGLNGGIIYSNIHGEHTVNSINLFMYFLRYEMPNVKLHANMLISIDDDGWADIAKYLDKKCVRGKGYEESNLKKIFRKYSGKHGIGSKDSEPLYSHVLHKWFILFRNKYYYRKVDSISLIEELIENNFPEGIAVFRNIDELLDIAKQEGYDPIASMSDIQLRGRIERSKYLILWDWGIYRHVGTIKNLHITDSLLDNITSWLDDKLHKKGVPKVSLWGAYTSFETECNQSGIPNEHALYSLLRVKLKDKYSFLKDPHVYPLDCSKGIIGVEVLENYLLDHDDAVPIEDIIRDLGYKEYQFQYYLRNSNNILNWGDKKVIHVEAVKINDELKNLLLEYAKSQLDKYIHISVKQIYEDNIVLCKKNQILTPRALYSVMSYYFGGQFVFTTYPYILKIDHDIEDDGRLSLNDIVESYFAKRNNIVYSQELHSYFVDDRGYNKNRIDSITYLCDNIVRYTRGAYISLDTIGWTEEDSLLLTNIATKLFNNKCSMGNPLASIRELLDEELPPINKEIEISWQHTLLRELLDRIDSVRLLGSGKDVYVITPNKYNIETTSDLVVFILKSEFNGAANKDLFIKRLKELDIVSSLSFINNTANSKNKIKISNEEVFIA